MRGVTVKIELKRIFDNPGEVLPLAFDLDLSNAQRGGVHPITTPVHISGKVENRAGIVSLGYLADYTLNMQCDRCLIPITRSCSVPFEHTIVEKLYTDENDELILCEDGVLDLDELIATDVLLELPIKVLCREDCKGLCPKCGANLNESSCGCDTRQVDPRLEALKKLLEEN